MWIRYQIRITWISANPGLKFDPVICISGMSVSYRCQYPATKHKDTANPDLTKHLNKLLNLS